MTLYEVRETNRKDKDWLSVEAISPADAIRNLIAIDEWYINRNVTELIDVRSVVAMPEVTLALLDDGKVTEVI